MPIPDTTGVSRRTALTAVVASGLALALGPLPAFADDASPDATEHSRVDHPIVGAWEMVILEGHPLPTIGMFNADGTYVEFDPDPRFGLGLGLWIPTGDRTAEVVCNFQRPARFEQEGVERAMFAVDYVPEPHAFLPEVVSLRLSQGAGVGPEYLCGIRDDGGSRR
jgi:hypothetical protein